jgi:hypothetical protein
MFSTPSMLWAGYEKKVVEILNPNNSIKTTLPFFKRASSFHRVCPFNFYDICKIFRVDSGCYTARYLKFEDVIF